MAFPQQIVTDRMKALLLTQPSGFLLACACIMFYPITRDRVLDVRRQLDERSAKHGALQR